MTYTHLAPYVRKSRKRYYEILKDTITDEKLLNETVEKLLKQEIKSGVQTIQYQINTLNSSNGQTPFVSMFMYLDEDKEYTKEVAMIIEEVLHQRILGIKNEQGVYITSTFPKLIYVLDENNIHQDSEYRYLTDLAIKCVAKRMLPDFISAKVMKKNYDGEVFPPINLLVA